ncbi:hypothetical protein [Sulfitobacter sp. JB4-11]|uniref:hypothetical protein n=1 Tax=Sulfitobacter rhodophyticola TaxID=3238304 RepID=UPI00351832A8
MIGVVLWSDPDGKSAVFWCEDQGDLAYFEQTEEPHVGGRLFVAGDMLSFDVAYEGRMRRASNPQVLVQHVGKSLPAQLRQTAKKVQTSPSQAANTSRCANIVALDTHRATLDAPALRPAREA